jgi:hypothetical protein
MTYSFRTNGDVINLIHTDNTSLQVENTVASFHNTSTAISWSLPEDENRISFFINTIEFLNILITEIDFDGTPMDSQDDFETQITAMFPGLAPGTPGGDGSAPLVYKADLSQSGTDAPVVEAEFINTIGAIVWTRTGVGVYRGTLAGAFTLNKTAVPPFASGLSCWLPFYGSTPLDFSYQMTVSGGGNFVDITVIQNSDGSNVDLSDVGAKILVQIEVYP